MTKVRMAQAVGCFGREDNQLMKFLDIVKIFKEAEPSSEQEAEVTVGQQSAAPGSALSADQPITLPGQDAFGLDPFAQAIAAGIANLRAPEGMAIGLHGPWGTGKSSVINLIKHHLAIDSTGAANDLAVIEFNPWWFSGSDALAIAFFGELGAVIGKSLPEQARSALQVLGRKLSSASPLIGAAVGIATAGAAGAAASGAASFLGDLWKLERTVPQEHALLAHALQASSRRYLVIIDDIDRLNPDEALLIFKLVKSVGRLPNVMYLLAFDRQLAERVVNERFPSEGSHFIEKIIQASFELPPPEPDDLRDLILTNIHRLIGIPSDEKAVRFMNVFYELVAPWIKRPRDVVRLTNALEVTWPPVADEVDAADFLAIETLRIFWPRVHRAIYNNRTLVCGPSEMALGRHRMSREECDQELLPDVPEENRDELRHGLCRIFPSLEGIWNNRFYDGGFAQTWRVHRRACVDAHFPTYFRFALSDQTAPAAEIDTLIASAGDQSAVQAILRMALATPRRRGGTRAAVLLDELTCRAAVVPEASIGPLVSAIFNMADELDVPADKARGFAIRDNSLRIHWLLNLLVTARLAEPVRDELIRNAAQTASLDWLISLTMRAIGQHKPKEDGRQREETPLVSAQIAEELRVLARTRIEEAVADGRLFTVNDPINMLFRWRDLIGEGGTEHVRAWLAEHLADDHTVITLAKSFVSEGWSQSVEDLVARRREYVQRDSVIALVDPETFLARIVDILGKPDIEEDDRAVLSRFQTVWDKPRVPFDD
jgi:predicted KAP-like P-loop ATPase